jgi:hypothetical protein
VQKEVSSTTPKKRKQDNRKINKVYRKDMTTGFLLLRKCVPGIEKLNRAGMLMSTVKYIMELQNKVRELENCIEKRNTTPLPMESTQPFSTPTDCDRSTGMKRDSVPKITLHYYPVLSTGTEQESDCTDKHSAPIVTEPKMADPSPMGLVTGLSSLMADYSDISELNSPTGYHSQMVTDILEMADPAAVSTPMEDHSTGRDGRTDFIRRDSGMAQCEFKFRGRRRRGTSRIQFRRRIKTMAQIIICVCTCRWHLVICLAIPLLRLNTEISGVVNAERIPPTNNLKTV